MASDSSEVKRFRGRILFESESDLDRKNKLDITENKEVVFQPQKGKWVDENRGFVPFEQLRTEFEQRKQDQSGALSVEDWKAYDEIVFHLTKERPKTSEIINRRFLDTS